MKISILLSIKWTDLVAKWIILYTLVITEVTVLCNDVKLVRWSDALIVKREVNVGRLLPPCEWVDDCKIECFSGGFLYDSSEPVLSLYNERSECHSVGIILSLASVVNNGLRPNWFSANIKIIELEMNLSNIDEIPSDPFRSGVFANVEKLILKQLTPPEFRKFIFTGLQSLETLIIQNVRFANIANIETGVLELVKNTLKRFELIEKDQKNNAISINKFIGDNTAVLSKLEYVKIRYNLSTINDLSFTTIRNVKELNLSDCQISSIGESTFETLGENLELLNLEGNMLVTLPVGMFANLNLSPTISDGTSLEINLSGNPWHCDCDIEHLKELLANFSNFEGDVLCKTPDQFEDFPIGVSEFCQDQNVTDTPTTTTPTTENNTDEHTPTSDAPTTVTPTTDNNTDEHTSLPTELIPDFIQKQCFSSNSYDTEEKISIKFQMHQTHVSVTSDEVSVLIESNEPNLALIWFATDKIPNDFTEYRQSTTIDCVIALQKQIIIKTLDRETAYTICLLKIVDTTVSPLDCISYYHHRATINEFWLLGSSKLLVIGIIVGVLIASIIVGMMFGTIFLRYNQWDPLSGKKISFSFRMALHHSKDNTVSIQETMNANLVDDSKDQENVSEQFPVNGKHSSFGSTSLPNSELSALDKPPPLPPYPKWLEIEENEDNLYATVKY